MTDAFGFEKLASDIMYLDGYYDLKLLGGVHDLGQDAVQDRFFYREGRVRQIFQYTLEDYILGKLRDTIKTLSENKIDYSELIIVTPTYLSTERQVEIKKTARKDYDITVEIYERKTITNRLSDFSNNLFYRNFPSLEQQLKTIASNKPIFDNADTELKAAMLKVSIAFVFGKEVDSIRKSMFDRLVLALFVNDGTHNFTIKELSDRLSIGLGCSPFPESQISAALHRLHAQGLLSIVDNQYHLTDRAKIMLEGTVIQANKLTSSLVSDIIETICDISDQRISEEEHNRLERNTKEVFAELFRLMGLELANQFLENQPPSLYNIEASEKLLKIAKRQINASLGELLVAAIADVIQHPTREQSQVFADWARAYIGATVMNLDPNLKEFQIAKFRNKIFILDTDFVLRSVVREDSQSETYRLIVQKLSELECRLIIPEAVIEECVTHAMLAPGNYKHSKNFLLGLTPEFVRSQIHNLFVQGYYCGKWQKTIPSDQSFEDYLQNYYEHADSINFFKDIIIEIFPSQTEIIDPLTLLSNDLSEEFVEQISDELLKLGDHTLQAEHRTIEQNEQIAHTDARLFATALKLNSKDSSQKASCILGGDCYIITTSSRYLRGARALNIRDVVSTKPQQILTLLELVLGPKIDNVAFVKLFENPLLHYVVEQIWDDASVLLSNGIALTGKSLTRLKWDFNKTLHDQISALRLAEEQETIQEDIKIDATAHEYYKLFQEITALGYSSHPALENLRQAFLMAQNEAEFERSARKELEERLDLLASEIDRFGKRKQRYLKKNWKDTYRRSINIEQSVVPDL